MRAIDAMFRLLFSKTTEATTTSIDNAKKYSTSTKRGCKTRHPLARNTTEVQRPLQFELVLFNSDC